MDPDPPIYHPAHLFTLRLWQEDLGDGATEWRGQVRSLETGKTRYFRDWPPLVDLLLAMAHPDAAGVPDGTVGNDTKDGTPGPRLGRTQRTCDGQAPTRRER